MAASEQSQKDQIFVNKRFSIFLVLNCFVGNGTVSFRPGDGAGDEKMCHILAAVIFRVLLFPTTNTKTKEKYGVCEKLVISSDFATRNILIHLLHAMESTKSAHRPLGKKGKDSARKAIFIGVSNIGALIESKQSYFFNRSIAQEFQHNMPI